MAFFTDKFLNDRREELLLLCKKIEKTLILK